MRELRVLLVKIEATRPTHLTRRLEEAGCVCMHADSFAEATSLLAEDSFDLVLSNIRLPDGSAYHLIPLLKGTKASMYCSHAAEDSTWWLSAVDHGRECWGTAFRLRDFVRVLDEFIRENAAPAAPGMAVANGRRRYVRRAEAAAAAGEAPVARSKIA